MTLQAMTPMEARCKETETKAAADAEAKGHLQRKEEQRFEVNSVFIVQSMYRAMLFL